MNREKVETQAEKLISKGKFLNAIDEYRKLLSGEERDIPIQNTIGDLFAKAGKIQEAIKEFKSVAGFYEENGLVSRSLALYKKINKLDPADIDSAAKLAALYVERGFFSDAKKEYQKIIQELKHQRNEIKALEYLKEILRFEPDDSNSRETFIDICLREGKQDQAIEELLFVANHEIKKNSFIKADKYLMQAMEIKEDHGQVLSALVNLYLKMGKQKQIFSLLNELIKKDKKNLASQFAIAELYYKEGKFQKAYECYSQIVEIVPTDNNARIKLGQTFAATGQPDEAFNFFEPLVDDHLRKDNPTKAIEFLRLILEHCKDHVPTLKKLISIYEQQNQVKNAALTLKLLISIYEKKDKKDKLLSALKKLLKIEPDNSELKRKLNDLTGKSHLDKNNVDTDFELFLKNNNEETIRKALKKVDLIAERGLFRNAKRMLEQLQISYPDNQEITDKMLELEKMSSGFQEDEISNMIEKKDIQDEDISGSDKQDQEQSMDSSEKMWSSADIFSDTDLELSDQQLEKKKTFYDLSLAIIHEMESIKLFSQGFSPGMKSIQEKEMGEIIKEFRRGIEEKIGQDNYQSRYTLGIAFMEQRLFDEAIEEFKIASSEISIQIDCYSLIGKCFKKKNNFVNAVEWLEKAIDLTHNFPDRTWALKYEIAELYEENKEGEKALNLYQEVASWNSGYREVLSKISKISA